MTGIGRAAAPPWRRIEMAEGMGKVAMPLASAVPLVEMTGIDKSFPGVRALSQVRFELLPGEVHALMGENGAGKSTLMKILSGVYSRDAGVVKLNGEPVEITSPRQAQDLGLSIIHQELALMRDLTAAQNIFIGREPRRFGMLDEGQLN